MKVILEVNDRHECPHRIRSEPNDDSVYWVTTCGKIRTLACSESVTNQFGSREPAIGFPDGCPLVHEANVSRVPLIGDRPLTAEDLDAIAMVLRWTEDDR